MLNLPVPTPTVYVSRKRRSRRIPHWVKHLALLAFLAIIAVVSGCGTGGYPGGGITGLSSSSITIDAGQSFTFTPQLSGSPNVSWALTGSSCSGNSCGTLSGATGTSVVYTAPTTTSQIKLSLKASVSGTNSSSTATITVNPAPTIAGDLPGGTVGVAYTAALTTSGGTAPLKPMSISSGALPAGLSFNGTSGVISGTPTATGTFNFTVQLTDSSDVPNAITVQKTITVTTGGPGNGVLTVIGGNPPAGTVGVAYSASLAASGGTSPYSWSVASGSLPAGLSLSGSSGVISGTPTTQGTSTFTAQVQDASGSKASAAFSITINPAQSTLTLTITNLPGATVGVPYTGTIGVSGGTAPYNCTIIAGTLPAGLTLTGCTVSGTPTTAGTSTLTVKVTDSSNPTQTTTGPVTLVVSPAALTLTISSLPNGTVGVPYTATIGVSGGTSPYACSVTAGTLPAGLTLTGCTVSGTPTTAGTANLTVHVTDSSSPQQSTSGPVSLTINPAPLSLTLSNLPDATVGTPYTATIGVTGGTSPYSCSIVSGSLPSGLSLTGCVVSGTPTVAGTVNLIVKATDSSSPTETVTGPVSLTVKPASVTLVITSPPNATVGVPYNGTIGVSGGTAPYSCTIISGTLPAGLTASGCVVSGTPTTAGSSTITVKATDASSPVASTTGPVTITVVSSGTLTLSSPPDATVGVAYTGTIGVSGGTPPYSCTSITGTLPAGLTATGCVISGTPTTAGTSTVTVTANDSSSPALSTTGPVTIKVNPVPALSLTGSLPNATVGLPYNQTLHATGGIAPYSYSVTAGSLPAGLSMSSAGVISGTPTAPGASSFTVTVQDSETTPQQATNNYVLLVVYPSGPGDSELNGPYAFLFQGYDDVLAGVLAYKTATIGSFTADGAGVLNNGEWDTNHQSSTATAPSTTVTSQSFVGTYQIGADNRGMMAVTAINADGTTGTTIIYAISVKAPVAPATTATEAQMIEFDGNIILASRGSGTILAQTSSAVSTGLSGSYVFGLSGDTPCLVSCTLNLAILGNGGPAASVGLFTASGSTISGAGDSNISAINYANAALAGSYVPADGNGRVELAMATSTTAPVTAIPSPYPTHYVVYIVDANHAFLMSTDVHSSYVLLAGSAQLQTQATFDNSSLDGAFIGYENAQAGPGLLGATLQEVLNLSTSTIFRATGSSGACNITNVDVVGVTGLVNQVTGLLGSLLGNIAQGLLGTYQSTGNAGCPIASNGRAVLNYPQPSSVLSAILALLGITAQAPPPRVVYMSSPREGYFLETGYAGIGNIEPQINKPSFTVADFNGTFVYGSLPAASLASIDTSGIITADGNGNANSISDLNIGIGNLNILQLGVASSGTYSVSDATAGRFTYGTNVIYEISPGRFVLVDTNLLATSPTVSLLY